MTLDDVLTSLFPAGCKIAVDAGGLISGSGPLEGGGTASVIGVAGRASLGVEGAAKLSGLVLEAIARGGEDPLLVLIDSDSQRMSRRDEMLGLSEYLAHLAKCLFLADLGGLSTVGLLYGRVAAGACIATALATRRLVALPGAEPAVMDLPSMARVTKLPIEALKEKAKSTPVFAPGLDNLALTGAVTEIWDPQKSLAAQLAALLAREDDGVDRRDLAGKERGGRPKAHDIARRVEALVDADG